MAKWRKDTKFWVQLSSGDKFEVDELDFNHIKTKSTTGRNNGYHVQRGASVGERKNWAVNMKDIAAFWADKEEMLDIPDRPIDINKRVLPEPKAKEPKPDPKCNHDWDTPETWEFHRQIISGMTRYHKVCKKCEAKSQLIKAREVEIFMEANGKTLEDVPFLE